MYEWVISECKAIRTPRFHVRIQGEVLGGWNLRTLPASYVEFMRKIGPVKLYRNGMSAYYLGILPQPVYARMRDGAWGLQIGFLNAASVFLRGRDDGYELAEQRSTAVVSVGCKFDEWLLKRCASARGRYSKAEWRAILAGPKPFSAAEREMLACRQLIEWRVAGTDEQRRCVFHIRNKGHRTLRILTVGVRSRDRRLNGAVRLNIGHIAPGEAGTVHASCYEQWVETDELEVFPIPNPEPEDRAYYSEFDELDG